MIRAYTFLLRPTARQTAALGEMLRDHCSLYNGALQERRFQCTACGFAANADHVGATNVLNRAGLALCAAA